MIVDRSYIVLHQVGILRWAIDVLLLNRPEGVFLRHHLKPVRCAVRLIERENANPTKLESSEPARSGS
jgi:hypothetical protein